MMLVRTPQPLPNESLPGYILRVSEANGYDSPWPVLQHAEIYYASLTNAALPVDKLAPILGVPESILRTLSYQTGGTCAEPEQTVRIMGHFLGRGQKLQPFRLKSPCICPHCIAEDGYISSVFDLQAIVACPRHGCNLVSQCPHCHQPLSWFRQGLLRCKCGGSLADEGPELAAPQLVELMSVLFARLNNAITSDAKHGLPASHLLGIPLRVLLRKLPDLGAMKVALEGQAPSMYACMLAAAEVLADWPNNFRRLLTDIGQSLEPAQRTLPLCRKYPGLYYKFFKVAETAEIFSWMREEFLRFGLEEDEETLVASKLLREENIERRFLSKSALARKFGLTATMLRRWEENGAVTFKKVSTASAVRFVADVHRLNVEIEPGQKETMGARDAAAALGVPVSVLNYMATEGHVSSRAASLKTRRFSEAAIHSLRQKILAASNKIQPDSIDTERVISLEAILFRLRFHSSESKGKFLVNYLAGRSISVGRTGDTFADIYFDQRLILDLVEESRSKQAGDSVSQAEAARALACNILAISRLMDLGMLTGVAVAAGVRVTSESLQQFAGSYISTWTVAKKFDTNTKGVLHLAKLGTVELLEVRTKHSTAFFLERRFEPQLEKLNADRTIKKAAHVNASGRRDESLKRLEVYLAEKIRSGQGLPISRRGTPNKSLIAKVCGFDRARLCEDDDFVQALREAASYGGQPV